MIFNQRGFTLPEILSAMAVLGVGLVGLLTVVPVASQSIQEGNNMSTATFLAGQRLEQVKTQPWDTTGKDCLGVSPGSPNPTLPPAAPAACTNGAFVVAAGGITFPDELPMGGQWANYN